MSSSATGRHQGPLNLVFSQVKAACLNRHMLEVSQEHGPRKCRAMEMAERSLVSWVGEKKLTKGNTGLVCACPCEPWTSAEVITAFHKPLSHRHYPIPEGLKLRGREEGI